MAIERQVTQSNSTQVSETGGDFFKQQGLGTGVRVGNGSVVGANSVVCSDIPPHTMAAGIPARPLRRWSESTRTWERIAPPAGGRA